MRYPGKWPFLFCQTVAVIYCGSVGKQLFREKKSRLFEGYINGREMNTDAHKGNGSTGQCISNRLEVSYHEHLNGQRFCGGFIKKVDLLSLALL